MVADVLPRTLRRPMPQSDVREQGESFERDFHALLERVIANDLHLDLLANRRQGSGLQRGYDLRTSWRGADRRAIRWHFECKSNGGNVSAPEVIPKLEQVTGQAHPLDVWCLVCAHAELTNEADQLLAQKRNSQNPPFAVTVLSRQEGFVDQLFECYPDLYESVYGRRCADLSTVERSVRLEAFRRYLDTHSACGQRRLLSAGWRLLSYDDLLQPEPTPIELAAFFRGLRQANSWPFVIHDLCVPRLSATRAMRSRFDTMSPGVDGAWLWGPGGEGKSVVLQQLAWHYVTHGHEVIWADRFSTDGTTQAPIEWLSAVARTPQTLLIADDVAVSRLDALRYVEGSLASADRRVFVMISGRAAARGRNPTLRRSIRQLAKESPEPRLPPITNQELDELADRLYEAGLVTGMSVADAKHRLRASRKPDERWLLPSIIELVDAGQRAFDRILEDVLTALDTDALRPSLRLLLVIAVVQSSGDAVSELIAARLAGSPDQLAVARDSLEDELASQFSSRAPLAAGPNHDRLLVYHDVIADGFSEVAARGMRNAWLAALRGLVEAVRPSVSDDEMVPEELFRILDRVARYLKDTLSDQAALEAYLRVMVSLDERQVQTWQRLGVCCSALVQDEAEKSMLDTVRVQQLVLDGSHAFDRAATLAKSLLENDDTPRPLRGLTRDDQLHYALSGAATLYGRAGACLENQVLLLRSLVTGLLAFRPGVADSRERRENAVVCGTLAWTLRAIGDPDASSAAYHAGLVLGNETNWSMSAWLVEQGANSPDKPLRDLAVQLRRACTAVATPAAERIGLYRSAAAQARAVDAAIGRVSRWTT